MSAYEVTVTPTATVDLAGRWHAGYAMGTVCAAWVTGDFQPVALQTVATARRTGVDAANMDESLRHYYVRDGEQRAVRVYTSAVMAGWRAGTDFGPYDIDDCRNCGLRVLPELEESWRCPADEHGVQDTEECRDELRCGLRCGA